MKAWSLDCFTDSDIFRSVSSLLSIGVSSLMLMDSSLNRFWHFLRRAFLSEIGAYMIYKYPYLIRCTALTTNDYKMKLWEGWYKVPSNWTIERDLYFIVKISTINLRIYSAQPSKKCSLNSLEKKKFFFYRQCKKDSIAL